MEEILQKSALAQGEALRRGEITAPALLQAHLRRIAEADPALHAFVCVDEAGAMAQAETAQRAIERGEAQSPLCGVPVAVKDNICVRGMETTCGSGMLAGYRPPYDAAVVERLRAAGLVLIGHTNMDEFAMGSTTETAVSGPTRNPWDTTRAPGGSSGGSAAAVAARMAPLALGSDTGGSIRQPAAFCGVTGLKPTYGAVSRYGLVAYASSLDQIGPLARTAADCAAAFDLLCARDARDATCRGSRGGTLAGLTGSVAGLRIGIPDEYFAEGLDEGVRERVLAAAETFRALGARVERFSLPIVPYAVPAYYILACAEASSNLSRYDGVKYGHRAEGAEDIVSLMRRSRMEGFGPETRRRILLGTFVLSQGYYEAYYLKALRVRARIRQEMERSLTRFDLILSPAAPNVAPRIGESLSDPLKMYLGDIYTVTANLAGLPCASFPCGEDEAGLPVGAQLLARPDDEALLLRAVDAFQRNTDFHEHKGGMAR
ncbi:MAG: Asp-tRNA(Asn)/Glu-tRNA(Gln) amidotransferase subunit GatA [Candidatus Spyradocola sp.]|jgi:aspartyl-tRNA(Asn)/glutamyl-tRNA(Gln) amidotransferase subunit A